MPAVAVSEVQAQREGEILSWVTNKCQTEESIGLEEGWGRLREFGLAVLERSLTENANESTGRAAPQQVFTRKGFVSLYTLSFRMCSQPCELDWSRQVYDRQREWIKSFLQTNVLPPLRAKRGEYLVQAFAKHWENHKIVMKWMFRLFMHLDKAYIENEKVNTLTSISLSLFKTEVYDEFNIVVCQAFLDLVDRDRDGGRVDRALLKSVTAIAERMGTAAAKVKLKSPAEVERRASADLRVYNRDLEHSYLRCARAYYGKTAQAWIGSLDVPAYVLAAERALAGENERVRAVLNKASLPLVMRVCREELIKENVKALLEAEASGCLVMLRDDRVDDLGRMFGMFAHVDGATESMATLFGQYVEQCGKDRAAQRAAAVHVARAIPAVARAAAASTAKVAPAASASSSTNKGSHSSDSKSRPRSAPLQEHGIDPEYVSSLIALGCRYEEMVRTKFNGSLPFRKHLELAMRAIVRTEPKNPELVCAYCDDILTGKKKLGDAELETELGAVAKLVALLEDKDLFVAEYALRLSKRLLNQSSVSHDLEKSFVSKLKNCYGVSLTSKLEFMLKDFAVCRDPCLKYISSDHVRDAAPRIDIDVRLLTEVHWPFSTQPGHRKITCVLPKCISESMQAFESWYQAQGPEFKKRKLTWLHSLGQCTVRSTFGKNTYLMTMVPLQAFVLLFFNDADGASETTVESIQEALQIDLGVLKRLLHSLACGKRKVLLKTPDSRSIKAGDRFRVNSSFSCRMRKFNIKCAILDHDRQQQIVNTRVMEARKAVIDAAIVRTMKARKTMRHEELCAQVIQQVALALGFSPDAKRLKSRIENLIEREYLERDLADRKRYTYLA